MSSYFKYIFAKNRVLLNLMNSGIITRQEFKYMKAVTMTDMNVMYGAGALKAGIAPNRFVAATMVFMRIFVISEKNPHLDETIPPHIWSAAMHEAWNLSGIDSQDMWDAMYESCRQSWG